MLHKKKKKKTKTQIDRHEWRQGLHDNALNTTTKTHYKSYFFMEAVMTIEN